MNKVIITLLEDGGFTIESRCQLTPVVIEIVPPKSEKLSPPKQHSQFAGEAFFVQPEDIKLDPKRTKWTVVKETQNENS